MLRSFSTQLFPSSPCVNHILYDITYDYCKFSGASQENPIYTSYSEINLQSESTLAKLRGFDGGIGIKAVPPTSERSEVP